MTESCPYAKGDQVKIVYEECPDWYRKGTWTVQRKPVFKSLKRKFSGWWLQLVRTEDLPKGLKRVTQGIHESGVIHA